MQNPSRRKAHMPTKRGSRAVTVEQSESKHGLLEGALYVPLKTHTEVLELPLLPIRNTVLMPNVVTQLNEEIEDPGPDDMYAVGVEGSIDRLLKMPDGSTSILIRGQRRLRLLEYTQQTPFMRVRVETVHEEAERTLALEALVRAVLALFEKCVKLSRTLPEEAYITAMNIDEPGWLADFILSSLEPSIAVRQDILEAFNVEERLQKISILLSKELNILELENLIHSQVQQEVDKTQREYFLREQLKAIQRELGETDPTIQEHEELREKILTCGMPEEVKMRANKELERLNALPSMAPDGGVIRSYLDWLVSLPWDKVTTDRLDIKEAAAILEENHYGLEKVKERVLE